MTILNFFYDNIYIVINLLALSGAGAWISAGVSDRRYIIIMKIINLIGANFGKAKNDSINNQ